MSERPAGASYVANAVMNYLVIGGMIYMIVPLFRSELKSASGKSAGAITNPVGVVAQLQAYTPVVGLMVPSTSTPTQIYTSAVTPSPLWSRVVPTVTKVPFQPSQVDFVFSYYNPERVAQDIQEFGYAVNCHYANLIYNKSGAAVGCMDTTASGLPWSRWRMFTSDDNRFMGGVAVPYYPDTYNPLYPMLSVIRVTSPQIIAGDYLVIDICPACDDYVSSHGKLFLDFDAVGLPNGVNFWTEVVVSDVFYPWENPFPVVVPTVTLPAGSLDPNFPQ